MTVTSDYIPEWPPNWTNAPGDDLRSYSSSDSVLIQTDDVTRCAVSTAPTTFVSIFSPIFMVFFWIFCWWFGFVDNREDIAFMTFGTFCGIATFGLIYAILKHHRDRGDYVVVDYSNQRVDLPRHNRAFNFENIRCLQLVTGRDKNDEVINNSDLNLIVDEGGDNVRYHLMGNPIKEHARMIAKAMNTPLIEQDVPSGWYRSSDRQSARESRIGGWRMDAVVIVAAVASFVVLGSLGGGIGRHLSTPRLIFLDDMTAVYWLRWGGAIVGRLMGDWICGLLLGRYLSRISPWHVLLAISAFPAIVLVANGFFLNVDSGHYLAQVGPLGVATQLIVQVGSMLGMVALGIWFGRWWKDQLTKRCS